jgi:hypothetical protein
MEPHQADRSVLDALELWITGLRPCWRGWTWPRPPGGRNWPRRFPGSTRTTWPCSARRTPAKATVEFSFAAGGRPAGAAYQARGWCPAPMVAFVMAVFCCACDDSFIPIVDGLLDACGTCGAASVLSGSTRRCGEKVHIHLHNSDDLGTGHYRVFFGRRWSLTGEQRRCRRARAGGQERRWPAWQMTSRVSGSGVRLDLTRSTTSGVSAGPARSHAASLASHAAFLAEPALSRVHSNGGLWAFSKIPQSIRRQSRLYQRQRL